MLNKVISSNLLVKEALAKLDLLDFSMLKTKLQDIEEGEGWPSERCDVAEADYKKFLALKFAYPKEEVVPNQEIDKFWHYHILDTKAYARDCQAVFGYFIHHFPYFGMRNAQDLQNLYVAFADTQALYKLHFGEEYVGSAPRCRTACKPVKCK